MGVGVTINTKPIGKGMNNLKIKESN